MKYEVSRRNQALSAMFMSAELLSGRIDCVLSQVWAGWDLGADQQ